MLMLNKLKPDMKLLREMDWGILITAVLIVLFGILNIYLGTGSTYYPKLQLIWLFLSLGVIYVILLVDYNVVKNFVSILYWGSVAFLVANMFLGSVVKGARGWISLGSRAIQPAEFAKLGMMLMLAKKIEEMDGDINTPKNLATLAFYAGIPMVLIVIQPDMGMTMVCFFIALGIVFIGGLDMKVLWGGLLSVLAAIAVVWNSSIMPAYWKRRLTSFLNPEADELNSTLQLLQSQIGIGSGGVTGNRSLFNLKGGSSYVSQFVPEHHTDFIFSVIAESWGLIGAIILLTLYGILIFKLIKTAREAKDTFGSLISVGVTSVFMFSVLQNIGMTIGLMPITGITLPLVSYGGSSMLTAFISLGMVLNVSMRRKKINF